MKNVCLLSALALRALSYPQDKLFNKLCEMYAAKYPDRLLILVHRDERLVGRHATYLGVEYREHYRLWMQSAA